MAAHHPRQNASSLRRMQSPGGSGVERCNQQRRSPPVLPLFSASSDHAAHTNSVGTHSSTSKSGSSSDRHHVPSTASSNTSSDTAKKGKRNHRHQRRNLAQDMHNRALSKKALMENDRMVYLDGPQVYTCANCRTHLTSHDDIISKSFHGRHGRAYLFDQCVNITTGPAEDRILITGLHSVSDIFCKRCETLVGWTYAKAYEASQKYKEGKFIIEKINLHLEESDHYDIDRPAGERGDKWRLRSMSWGSERSLSVGSYGEASSAGSRAMGSPSGVMLSPGGLYHSSRDRSGSLGGSSNYSSSYHRSPQTPTRRSPAAAMMMPKSPGSPSDIIYEYRRDD